MREILHKGKRLDNGKWVEGNYCQKKTGHYENGKFVEEVKHLIIVNMTGGGYQYAEVDSETICQYTGLSDKYGRRYEGDIFQVVDIECACTWIYVIKWDDKLLRWSANNIEEPYIKLPLSDFRIEEIRVIGNIFDDPELMMGWEEGHIHEHEYLITKN